jgi:hypothetical protein
MTKRQADEIDRINHRIMAAVMLKARAESSTSDYPKIMAREAEAVANRLLEV